MSSLTLRPGPRHAERPHPASWWGFAAAFNASRQIGGAVGVALLGTALAVTGGVASPHGSTGLHAAVLVAVVAFTVAAVLTRRTRELAHPRLANPPRSTAG